MSRYVAVVVLVVFGCVLPGIAQEKPVPMPVIDCVVEYSHGFFDSYGSVMSGDTITLDLNAIDKIALNFKSKTTNPSYIGQRGPFRVEAFHNEPSWSLKLVSGPDPRVVVYVHRFTAPCAHPKPGTYCEESANNYEVIIMMETSGLYPGIVVLKGTGRN